MWVKSLKFGNVTTRNNVFLAPLAGYSDASMRVIATELGAGLAFTEMVSAKGLIYNSKNTEELLFTYPEESIKAVQIFGSEPNVMRMASKSKYLEKFDVIDINMGCPVKKIYSNGEGSALLNDLRLASNIISAVKDSGKTVTVKFRIGIEEGKFITKEFAKMCEDSGADLISIHGRVRNAMYAGECNFEQIALAKSSVKIPVIANGGIFNKKDADLLMENTGADGVMVARGAMQNPLIFSEILGVEQEISFKKVLNKHLTLIEQRYGKERAGVVFRKQMAFYLKGIKNAKRLKEQVFSAKNSNEIRSVINSLPF